MLSKIIKLEDVRDSFVEYKSQRNITKDMIDISMFMEFTIEAFKTLTDAFKTLTDEVVRLKEIVKSQSYQITDLRKRVKKLEQQDNPNEEEIKNIKVGGTD